MPKYGKAARKSVQSSMRKERNASFWQERKGGKVNSKKQGSIVSLMPNMTRFTEAASKLGCTAPSYG